MNDLLYLPGQRNKSGIDMIETLVKLILSQRDLRQEHFFTGIEPRLVLGMTSSFIAGDACDYVSFKFVHNTRLNIHINYALS